MRGRRSIIELFILLSLTWSVGVMAATRLTPGTLLVASESMEDPLFRQSVVILLEVEPERTTGLIINRMGKGSVAEALPQLPDLPEGAKRLFFGGPVQPRSFIFMLRDEPTPEGATEVVPGLFVSGRPNHLEALLQRSDGEGRIRIFAGYSAWGEGQLQREWLQGYWHRAELPLKRLFTLAPDQLWPTLIAPLRHLRTGVHQGSGYSPATRE